MRRVVVTGMGIVSPFGLGIDHNWHQLIAGKSAIRSIDTFDVTDLPSQIAGLVPKGAYKDNKFDIDEWVCRKDQKKIGPFIAYGLAAATQALQDAQWLPEKEEDCLRTGVMVGSGIGGLQTIYDGSLILHEKGYKKLSPYFIPACLINMTSGHISMKYNLKGPNHSAVTACSTGAHAIGDAFRMIMFGDADVMVAGGTEAAVSRIGIGGFSACRALSTSFNHMPSKASRPWDKQRDGFVMSDGAGVLILEEYEHAKKRNARIHAEIIGYGLSSDAYHITSPSPDGNGALRAMQNALKNAHITADHIDYVNAHGTSTPLGDAIEFKAIQTLFGHKDDFAMSSTKSSTGHLLGAAGGVESIFSILSLKHNILPPTINLDEPSEEFNLNLVAHKAQEKNVSTVLSNSFGFGGTNASLIFKKI